jgi:flavodoxin
VRSVVVYYSKTGNTRKVAEAMAQEIYTQALPLNLSKPGKRTEEERAEEKALFSQAVAKANNADIVLIGTPTEFRQPHPR